MDESELLTVSQAAEQVGATSQTVRNWIRAGQLKAERIGNRFLVPRAEIERLRRTSSHGDGDSPWDVSDKPPTPLQRRSSRERAGVDSSDRLLGG